MKNIPIPSQFKLSSRSISCAAANTILRAETGRERLGLSESGRNSGEAELATVSLANSSIPPPTWG